MTSGQVGLWKSGRTRSPRRGKTNGAKVGRVKGTWSKGSWLSVAFCIDFSNSGRPR